MTLMPIQDTATTVSTYMQLAKGIASTDFVPVAYKNKPDQILACLMFGSEIGLGPMQSLATINVIQGKPSLSPEGMRALVLQAGHRIWPEKQTAAEVVMCGQRKGDAEVVRVTWSSEDARRAGLTGGSWQKYPRAMLLARATSELCRTLFPDVIAGLSYTPEEVESIESDDSQVLTSPMLPPGVDGETGEVVVEPLAPVPTASPPSRKRKPPSLNAAPQPEPLPPEEYHERVQEVHAELAAVKDAHATTEEIDALKEMIGAQPAALRDALREWVKAERIPMKPELCTKADLARVEARLEELAAQAPFAEGGDAA